LQRIAFQIEIKIAIFFLFGWRWAASGGEFELVLFISTNVYLKLPLHHCSHLKFPEIIFSKPKWTFNFHESFLQTTFMYFTLFSVEIWAIFFEIYWAIKINGWYFGFVLEMIGFFSVIGFWWFCFWIGDGDAWYFFGIFSNLYCWKVSFSKEKLFSAEGRMNLHGIEENNLKIVKICTNRAWLQKLWKVNISERSFIEFIWWKFARISIWWSTNNIRKWCFSNNIFFLNYQHVPGVSNLLLKISPSFL
jgi:hypothetical protein